MDRKFLIFLLVILACGPLNNAGLEIEAQIDDAVKEALETTTTTVKETPTSSTTTTALEIETSSEEIRYRRGVLRYGSSQHIPLITKTKDSYTEVEIVPDHAYIEYFTYDVRFPQLNEDITCSEVVNEEILIIMNSFVKEVEDTLNYYTPEDAEANGDRFFEQLWINYDFVEISEEVISLIITRHQYSSGAVHPRSDPTTLNFDLRDCSKIEISLLFDKEIKDYEDILAREMKLQLCAPDKDELTCNESIYSDVKTLTELEYCCSALAISRYGLFVQFWEYEVSGYVQGSELILIPWYDISKILDKGGPYVDILKVYSEQYWTATIYEPEWDF